MPAYLFVAYRSFPQHFPILTLTYRLASSPPRLPFSSPLLAPLSERKAVRLATHIEAVCEYPFCHTARLKAAEAREYHEHHIAHLEQEAAEAAEQEAAAAVVNDDDDFVLIDDDEAAEARDAEQRAAIETAGTKPKTPSRPPPAIPTDAEKDPLKDKTTIKKKKPKTPVRAPPAVPAGASQRQRHASIEAKRETWDEKDRVLVLSRETQNIIGIDPQNHAAAVSEDMAHLAVESFEEDAETGALRLFFLDTVRVEGRGDEEEGRGV